MVVLVEEVDNMVVASAVLDFVVLVAAGEQDVFDFGEADYCVVDGLGH